MGTALLLEYYQELPHPHAGEGRAAYAVRLEGALGRFKSQVEARYSEGTLQRLLRSADRESRRAAVVALRLCGTMDSNEPVAALLRDDDEGVRQLAADALWSLWFRGASEAHSRQLQRLMKQSPPRRLEGLTALVQEAPTFAEAYNQRAIVYFSLGQYVQSIDDCDRVLRLNPFHFGALSGMAQCHLKLRNRWGALTAFRRVRELFPTMEGIEETIRALEDSLRKDGSSGDGK